jgi:hypothetical protein
MLRLVGAWWRNKEKWGMAFNFPAALHHLKFWASMAGESIR